jgi:MFS family permease
VSISFAPILLSVNPTPRFETTKPMTLLELWRVSPLGCVGVFLLGGVFSALFGMAAVYGTQAGFTVPQISLFIAVIYTGGLLMQYPIGWISDRMDRRILIMTVSIFGGAAALVGVLFGQFFAVIVVVSFFVGGTANPLYALLLAYTNDMLDSDQMAAGSGGMIFINGVGAITGPLITGWIMTMTGPNGFWLFVAILMLATGAYALWRMTRRPARVPVQETGQYVPLTPTASPVAVEIAQEWYAEHLDDNTGEDATVRGAEQ